MQGVASGDPFPKSVILWARVTPQGGLNKPAFLDYAVATDKCGHFTFHVLVTACPGSVLC